MVRFGTIYISSSKKFCHLDKNKENYLIGIKPHYTYNVYDAEKKLKRKNHGKRVNEKIQLSWFSLFNGGTTTL